MTVYRLVSVFQTEREFQFVMKPPNDSLVPLNLGQQQSRTRAQGQALEICLRELFDNLRRCKKSGQMLYTEL